MGFTVKKPNLEVDRRIPGQYTMLQCLDNALFHGRHKIPGNIHARKILMKFKSRTLLKGEQIKMHLCKLTTASRLFLMSVNNRLYGLLNGFAIGDFNRDQININIKFAVYLLSCGFQMDLAGT